MAELLDISPEVATSELSFWVNHGVLYERLETPDSEVIVYIASRTLDPENASNRNSKKGNNLSKSLSMHQQTGIHNKEESLDDSFGAEEKLCSLAKDQIKKVLLSNPNGLNFMQI